MTDEGHPARLGPDALGCLVGPQHVLPDGVARGSVIEGHFATLIGRVEHREEVDRGLLHALPRPAHGGRRGGREGRDVELLEHGEVVVADETHRAAFADQGRALVRLGAVTDDVAQAPGFVDACGLGAGEDRLERGQVGVNVAEQGETHDLRSPNTADYRKRA